MSRKKISQLPIVTQVSGPDQFVFVQAGVTKRITASGMVALLGVTGTPGGAGPAGATGPAGVGSTGPTGAASTAVGPTGPAGVGSTGPAGAQGIQGVQGIQGNTGPTGAQGVQGNIGPTGAASTVTGPTGANSIYATTGVTALAATGFFVNLPIGDFDVYYMRAATGIAIRSIALTGPTGTVAKLLVNEGTTGSITLSHATGATGAQFRSPWLGDVVLPINGGSAVILSNGVDWRVI